MMDKTALNDQRLSLRAKGLLAYLLSKPPDWSPRVKEVCSHCQEGREAVETAFRELETLGYAKKMTIRGSRGAFGGKQWCLFERPELSTEEPKNRKPVLPVHTNNSMSTKNKALAGSSDFREVSVKGLELINREQLVGEAKAMVERILGSLKGTRFWEVWIQRAEQCPFRTECAIGWLEEDLATIELLRKSQRRAPVIRNVGGKADWYFNRVNLETARIME